MATNAIDRATAVYGPVHTTLARNARSWRPHTGTRRHADSRSACTGTGSDPDTGRAHTDTRSHADTGRPDARTGTRRPDAAVRHAFRSAIDLGFSRGRHQCQSKRQASDCPNHEPLPFRTGTENCAPTAIAQRHMSSGDGGAWPPRSVRPPSPAPWAGCSRRSRTPAGCRRSRRATARRRCRSP